jgi:hypothetical protein
MKTVRDVLLVVAAWLTMAAMGPPALAATPIHKCVHKGAVTYQRDPCPAEGPRQPQPTAAQLNRDRADRGASAAPAAAAATTAAPVAPAAASTGAPQASPPSRTPAFASNVPATGATSTAGYRCDGRTYCSQMSSCAEARFFLAHCPGVKMDGDGNGVPCEQQWCGLGVSGEGNVQRERGSGRR